MITKVLKLALVVLSLCAASITHAATTWSTQDYDLYPGDFNGDGKTDILYIAKSADNVSGIAISDGSGPNVSWQSWPSNFLGIQWYGNQFVVVVGDFNHDGKADVLLQSTTSGYSYLLQTDASGRLTAISQTIPSTYLGLSWSKDQHVILVGDFNGDGRTDLFFQATSGTGTNAVILADANGQFTTGPLQTWTDSSWSAFKWSTKNSVISVGDFNGDGKADLLVQAKPNIVMIDYDIPIPVPVYAPNSFGVVLSQVGAIQFQQAGVLQWNRNANGVDWSPNTATAVIGDFNGDGLMDVLLQSKNGSKSSYLLTGNSTGSTFSTGTVISSNVALSADSARVMSGKFAGGSNAGVYIQSITPGGTNYIANTVGASILAVAHDSSVVTGVVAVTAVGRTAGSFAVSGAGASTYSIPIVVPKGVAGIQPSLTIGYSSGSGNGLLGVGWGLSGLSEISRCAKTIAQDGATTGVNLTTGPSGDRFCLDGRKLRVTSGSYGAAESTYQTEIEVFSRITAKQNGGNGLTYFRVEGKDGLYYEYGNTVDSNIQSVGTSTPRTWALNKVSDRYGNYMAISYCRNTSCLATDPTNGSFRPNQITYTSNDSVGLTAPYRVSFVWETRPAADTIYAYVAGGSIQETTRLKGIETRYNNSLVRKYQLSYSSAPNVTQRSRLQSVQECEGKNGTCLSPTIMAWQDGQSGVGSDQTSLNVSQFVNAIDINGDGFTDLVYPCGTTWCYMLANSQGSYGGQIDTAIPHNNKYSMAVAIDFDSDGLMDLLVPDANNQWQVLRSTGSNFTVISTGVAAPPTSNLTQITDFDGDGRQDIVMIQPANSGTTNGTVLLLFKNTGSGFTSVGTSTPLSAYPQAYFSTLAAVAEHQRFAKSAIQSADFNGDGKADLVVFINDLTPDLRHTVTRIRVLNSTGSGYILDPNPIAEQVDGSISPIFEGLRIADINGDGNADLIYECPTNTTNRCVRFGTGVGLGAEVDTGRSVGVDQPSDIVIDWNGDGRTDLLQANANGNFEVLLATGNPAVPFATAQPTNIANTTQVRLLDVNGDGMTDLGYVDAAGLWHYRVHAGIYPDLLHSVTDGFGNTATVTYAPLTDNSMYTKGTGIAFPEMAIQLPFYVAKQVSMSDGVGSTYAVTETYADARLHLQGRGFEGFANRTEVDSRTSVQTVWFFRQDFPFIGLPASVQQRQPGNSPQTPWSMINSVTTNYDKLTLDSTSYNDRYYPYSRFEDRQTFEVGGPMNGQAFNESFTTNTVDVFGNISSSDTRVGMAAPYFDTVTTNLISNDTSSWCLGFVTQQQVAKTVPALAAQTRTIQYVQDPSNLSLCRVKQQIIEPAIAALKVTTTYAYDAFGHINSQTVSASGIADRVTTTDYGSLGVFPISVTNAAGEKASQGFDYALGAPISNTDANNFSTSWQYDGFGRKQRQTNADNTAVVWTISGCTYANGYCGDSLLRYQIQEQQVDTTGAAIRSGTALYDAMNRVLYATSQTLSGAASVIRTIYNNRGLVAQRSAPYFSGFSASYTTYDYDFLNRPLSEVRPINDTNSGTQRTQYLYKGLTRTITDANTIGRITTKTVNALGQVVQMLDPAGANTYYTYDPFGNLLTTTDPLNNVITNTFDIRGFKKTSSDPDMGNWSYTYYATGELSTQTDAKSQIATFTYDAVSRPLTRVEAEGTTVFTYGTSIALRNMGKLVSVSSPGGYSQSITYDTLGRTQDTTTNADATAFVVSNSYNATTGFLDTVTYPQSTAAVNNSRFKVQYDYAYGLLKDVKDFNAPTTIYWQQIASNAAGQAIDEQYGNNLHTYSLYDSITGRLSTRTTGSSSQVQNLSYQWDSVGNLSERKDQRSGITEDFYYDARYRLDHSTLTIAGTTAPNLTMGYDVSGNITSKSDVGTYSYPASGTSAVRPHAVITAGTNSFAYDGNGNMTTRNGDATTWYSYNLPNRINKGSNYSQFFYAAGRERYKQVAFTATGGNLPSGTETTVYVGSLFEKVTKPSGVIEYKHYIFGGKDAVAIRTLRSNAANDTRYLHKDHLGGVDTITDESGNAVLRLSADAFGKRRSAASWSGGLNSADWTAIASITHRAFTFHEQLDNVDLIHMNGRVYDPNIGRFLSADPLIQAPLMSQSLNRYSYVMNNPLSFMDPSGFKSLYDVMDSDAAHHIADLAQRWIPVVMTVVASYGAGTVANGLAGGGFWGSVAGGAAGGTASGLAHVFFYGGNARDVLRAALIGGITGALAGWLSGDDGSSSIENGEDEGQAGLQDHGASQEPSDIDNDVIVNRTLNSNKAISISHGTDGTTMNVRIEYGSSNLRPGEENRFLEDIEKHANVTVTNGTDKITMNVTFMSPPASRPPFLYLKGCGQGECGVNSAGEAVRGGSKILIGDMRDGTGSHELFHILGLGHQANATRSIMSYADSRSLLYIDAKRLVDKYELVQGK